VANKRELEAVWDALRRTPPYRRILKILSDEEGGTKYTKDDAQGAIIKYVRGLLSDDLNAAKGGPQ
jgi:hypothetical protein